MPYSEDAQPNEVRHSRKGNSAVPTIRSFHHSSGHPRNGRGFGRSANTVGYRDHRGYGTRETQYSAHGNKRGFEPVRGANSVRASDSSSSTLRHSSGSPWSMSNRDGLAGRPKKKHRVEHTTVSSRDDNVVSPPSEEIRTRPADSLNAERSCKSLPLATPELASASDLSGLQNGPGPHRRTWLYDPAYSSLSVALTRRFCGSPGGEPSVARHNRASVQVQDDRRPASPVATITGANLPDGIPKVPKTLSTKAASLLCSSPELQMSVSKDLVISELASTAEESMPSPFPPDGHATPSDPLQDSCTAANVISTRRRPRFRSGTLRIRLPPNSPSVATPQAPLVGDREFPGADVRHVSPDDSQSHHLDAAPVVPQIFDGSTSAEDGMLEHESSDPSKMTFQYVEGVQMRRDPHDKPRRLLTLPNRDILSVTMRGFFDYVEQMPLRCSAVPAVTLGKNARQLVDDACLLPDLGGNTVVLGRSGEAQQLSLVRLQGKKKSWVIKVLDVRSIDRTSQADKKGGISAVCTMMQPATFATGGYDHVVSLWRLLDGNRAKQSAPLAIRHTSVINSLLPLRDTSHKLVTGSADCSVCIYDISSERTVNTLKLSNSVHHVHATMSPFCTLLEIAHRELQFEIRDYRVVPVSPALRFGYASTKIHGRYTKGALQSHIFACGGNEKDGCVRLWDVRKPSEVMQTVPCFPGRKANQVVLNDAQMVVCSEDHQLAFMRWTEK